MLLLEAIIKECKLDWSANSNGVRGGYECDGVRWSIRLTNFSLDCTFQLGGGWWYGEGWLLLPTTLVRINFVVRLQFIAVGGKPHQTFPLGISHGNITFTQTQTTAQRVCTTLYPHIKMWINKSLCFIILILELKYLCSWTQRYIYLSKTVEPKTPATGFRAKIRPKSTHTPIESSRCGLFIDGMTTLMF